MNLSCYLNMNEKFWNDQKSEKLEIYKTRRFCDPNKKERKEKNKQQSNC